MRSMTREKQMRTTNTHTHVYIERERDYMIKGSPFLGGVDPLNDMEVEAVPSILLVATGKEVEAIT